MCVLDQQPESDRLCSTDSTSPHDTQFNSSGPDFGTRRKRITLAALVLGLTAGTCGLLSVSAYRLGRNTESDLRFLEPRRPPTVDEAVIALPIEYALRSDERNDVIFLGDSACRCGIDPVEFTRSTGLRAYNLGSQGRAGPMAIVLTAKAYLLRHPPPKIVVLCVSPIGWDMSTDRRDDGMRARLLANYGPEVEGLVPWNKRVLYFIKRGSLAASAARSVLFTGPPDDVRDFPLVGLEGDTYRTLERRTRESRGYGRLPGLHHAKEPGLERKGEPVTVPDAWDRGVRLLAETCHAMGIPLLVRFSPMPGECARMRDFSPVEKWARTLESSCSGVIVGRPTLLWYDWKLCWDAFHLNAEGTAKYTQAVAVELRSALVATGRSTQN
jgi:hypothetical protein